MKWTTSLTTRPAHHTCLRNPVISIAHNMSCPSHLAEETCCTPSFTCPAHLVLLWNPVITHYPNVLPIISGWGIRLTFISHNMSCPLHLFEESCYSPSFIMCLANHIWLRKSVIIHPSQRVLPITSGWGSLLSLIIHNVSLEINIILLPSIPHIFCPSQLVVEVCYPPSLTMWPTHQIWLRIPVIPHHSQRVLPITYGWEILLSSIT